MFSKLITIDVLHVSKSFLSCPMAADLNIFLVFFSLLNLSGDFNFGLI
jgi:hypothetical protein